MEKDINPRETPTSTLTNCVFSPFIDPKKTFDGIFLLYYKKPPWLKGG